MKILLDESNPIRLRNDFGSEHEVQTVRDKGWLGIRNRELLLLMINDKFELFITVDRNLIYQNNIDEIKVKIVILCTKDNRRTTLSKLIPKIFDLLDLDVKQNIFEIS